MNLLRRHPLLVAAFLAALGLTAFFGARFVAHAVYWSDPAHRNQAVAPWMTVGYIARSWGLSAPELDAEAGLPGPGQTGTGRPMTLRQIAETRGVPVAEVIADVQGAIARIKARDALRRLGD
ncbi:MAG: hypothetical protein N2422_11165 [Rhodobacteraceae bacterium]|nr:hypothetical protein [Paracoccaceae bacterium]